MRIGKSLKLTVIAAACACTLLAFAGCSAPSGDASQGASGGSAPAESPQATTAEPATAVPLNDGATGINAGSAADAGDKAGQEGAGQSNAGQDKNAGTQSSADALVAQGYQVFTGTVRVMSGADLITFQDKGIDPATFGDNGTYAVLIFDGPTEVAGMGADGSGERTETASMLGLAYTNEYASAGNLDSWTALDGKKATVAVKAADIWFPSDVRLPIGEPSTSKAQIVE